MQASGCAETLSTDATDYWGAYYTAGTHVVRGLYFDRIDNHGLKYKLIKRKSAIVPAKSILYICSDVIVSNGTFQMCESTHLDVLSVMNEIDI